MAYGELSPGFKKYKALRDKKVAGLERCDFVLTPADLDKAGFTYTDGETFSEGVEEHEFREYTRDECRAVYLETYIEREGGMYIQTLFASADCIDTLQKLVNY